MPATRVELFATVCSVGIALGVAFIAARTPAHAQDDLRKKGDIACKTDAPRLCRHAFSGGDMAILQCFQLNKVRLSHTCRRFLTDIGQLY